MRNLDNNKHKFSVIDPGMGNQKLNEAILDAFKKYDVEVICKKGS
jgi:hypothetical protein